MNDFLLSGSHRTSSGVTCVVDSASRREGNLMNRSRMVNGMLQRLTMEVEIRQNRFITEPVVTWATDIAFAGANAIGLENLARRVDAEDALQRPARLQQVVRELVRHPMGRRVAVAVRVGVRGAAVRRRCGRRGGGWRRVLAQVGT